MPDHGANNGSSVINRQAIIRSIITLAVIAVLYLLIRRLSGVLLPFLISFVVAYMLAPLVNFFQHKCRLKNRVLSIRYGRFEGCSMDLKTKKSTFQPAVDFAWIWGLVDF